MSLSHRRPRGFETVVTVYTTEHGPVTVPLSGLTGRTTFKDLRLEALGSLYGSNAIDFTGFFVLEVQFLAGCRTQRIAGAHVPHLDAPVFESLCSAQTGWMGSVSLVLRNLRQGVHGDLETIPPPIAQPLPSSAQVAPIKLDSGIEWIGGGSFSSSDQQHPGLFGSSLSERIYLEIASRSSKQGRLLKRISTASGSDSRFGYGAVLKHKEDWVEQCVLLDADALWCYSIPANSKELVIGSLSCIPLSTPLEAARNSEKLYGGDSSMDHTPRTQASVYFYDESPTCLVLCVASKRYLSETESPAVVDYLRAKNRQEAEEWLDAILNRCLAETFGDNDEFIKADSCISRTERTAACKDFGVLAELVRFEHMLSNSLLRGAFQTFLTSNHVQESFNFWEYAEDFRRGHPSSPEPFPLVGEGGVKDVHGYGTAIYRTFLEAGAHMEVSDCSSEEGKRIKEALFSTSGPTQTIPNPNTFLPVQRVSYMKLKYTDGHYPSFIVQGRYRKILCAALYLKHRIKREQTCATSLLSDATPLESSADAGSYFDTAVPNNRKVAAVDSQATGPRRIRMWDRLLGRRVADLPSKSAVVHNDRSKHDEVGFPRGNDFRTPWRNVKGSSSSKIWAIEPLWFPQWWWSCASLSADPSEITGGFLRTSHGFIPLIGKSGIDVGEKIVEGLSHQDPSVELVQLMDRNRSSESPADISGTAMQITDSSGIHAISYIEGIGNVLICSLLKVRLVPQDRDDDGGMGGRAVMPPAMSFSSLSASFSSAASSHGNSPKPPVAPNTSPISNSCRGFYGGTIGDPSSGSDWVSQFAVLSEFEGKGSLFLFDAAAGGELSSSAASGSISSGGPATGFLRSRINLANVGGVRCKERGLHCFEIATSEGLWQFIPVGSATDEKGRASQAWVYSLWPFCKHQVGSSAWSVPCVRVLLCGHLNKRGEVNISYKRRWFTYTSDMKISYYQDTLWRGSIPLEELETVCFYSSSDAGGGRGAGLRDKGPKGDAMSMSNEQEFAIVTKKRVYYLHADSSEDAARWVSSLCSLLKARD